MRTHIKRLRHKLKLAGAPELLETVYGLGYRLNEAGLDDQPRSIPVFDPPSPHPNEPLQRPIVSTAAPARTTDAKIMVVDDDLLTLRLLQVLLEPWGFQVTTLSQPQAFWDRLNQINPDLLVLDVQMPEISSLD